MGAIGKCAALYVKAECEYDAREFALLSKQASTVQDVIPNQPPLMFEDMFNEENADCIELTREESQSMTEDIELGVNLVKVELEGK